MVCPLKESLLIDSEVSDDVDIFAFVDLSGIGPKTTKTYKALMSTSPPSHRASLQQYQVQNSADDGFVRLYTMLGHRYWIAQAEMLHRTPDWKLHFSVDLEDVPLAWNIIAFYFIKRRCLSAMKAVNLMSSPPDFMRGREITVYIYRYHQSYIGKLFYDEDTPFDLDSEYEQTGAFWLSWASYVDDALSQAGVRCNGLADGDRLLGRYCSYRNEAFVRVSPTACARLLAQERAFQETFSGAAGRTYPPNILGYNAARHADPFSEPSNRRAWFAVFAFIIAWVVAFLLARH